MFRSSSTKVLVQFTIHRLVNICVGTRTICTSTIHNTQTSQYMFKYKNNMYQFNTQFIDKSICVSTSTICTSTIHNTQTSQYICQYKNNVYDVSPLKSHLPSPHSKDCVPFSVSRFGFPLGYSFCYKRTNKTESNFLSYGRLSNNRNTC